jgi:hypothetical protein
LSCCKQLALATVVSNWGCGDGICKCFIPNKISLKFTKFGLQVRFENFMKFSEVWAGNARIKSSNYIPRLNYIFLTFFRYLKLVILWRSKWWICMASMKGCRECGELLERVMERENSRTDVLSTTNST